MRDLSAPGCGGGEETMPDEAYLAAWRALREHDHKYAYYKLTIVGAAIALAINQTNDAALSWRQVPLALAVLMWGLSMWFGFSHLKSVRNVLIQDAYRSGDFEASVLKGDPVWQRSGGVPAVGRRLLPRLAHHRDVPAPLTAWCKSRPPDEKCSHQPARRE